MDISMLLTILEIGVIAVGGKVLWSINQTIRSQKEIIESQKILIDGFKSQSDYLSNIVKSVETAQKFFDPALLDSALKLHTQKIEYEHTKKYSEKAIVEHATVNTETFRKLDIEPDKNIAEDRIKIINKDETSKIVKNYIFTNLKKSLEIKE